jgi:hypothetical protein
VDELLLHKECAGRHNPVRRLDRFGKRKKAKKKGKPRKKGKA